MSSATPSFRGSQDYHQAWFREYIQLGYVSQACVALFSVSRSLVEPRFSSFFLRHASKSLTFFSAMDVLWMIALLVIPFLMFTSSTFVFYFKKFFYVAWMMLLAVIGIPLCILKSGGRDIENMRWAFFFVCLRISSDSASWQLANVDMLAGYC